MSVKNGLILNSRFTFGILFILPVTILTLFFTNCSSPHDNNFGGKIVDPSKQGPPENLTVEPKDISINSGSQVTFKVSGGTAPYEFSLDQNFGSINENGVYSAPSTAGNCQINIVDAKGNMGNATVTVNAGTTFSVSPLTISMKTGTTQQFKGVNGKPPYTYTVSGGGTITAEGTFTAPATKGTATVTVTDSTGAKVNAVATITADDGGGGGGVSTAPLYRYIRETPLQPQIDYFMTFSSAPPSGYKPSPTGSRFRIITASNIPDTIMLYSCVSKSTGKHYITTTTNCGSSGKLVEIYGYVYAISKPNTAPVIRLHNPNVDRYYVAMDPAEIAQKRSEGYGSEVTLGWSYGP